MEKVSVIVPTFNQVEYLPACIDHVLFQTWPDIEVIIVDGGSSDGTKKFLSDLKDRITNTSIEPVERMDDRGNVIRKTLKVYPNNRELRILSFDRDIGATKTYNEGLGIASGQYCTYIAGDDIAHPHMIEELVKTLKNTGADFIYSDMNLVNDRMQIVRQMRLTDYSFERCFAQWFHLGVSRLYRTEWHQKVGLMDETYESANDYDHYLRFAMAGCKFHHVPKILYSVRYHGEGRRTGQHNEKRYANLIEESKRCAKRARAWLAGGGIEDSSH